MDPRNVLASLDAFGAMLPTVYVVLGIIWLAALAWWIAQKVVAFTRRPQPEAQR